MIAVTLAEEGLVEIEAPIVLVESLPKKIVPEACYPHWEGNTCLILPHNAYAWLEVFDEIDLLITGLLCYQSLWFQYAAERTEGRIVKINTESLPSLIVEYRTAKTSPLRIESDGSEVYREYQVGDTLAVFYDPANPGDARLDLFLEHWLMTMLAGGVTLAVFLLLVLIRRNFASVRSLR